MHLRIELYGERCTLAKQGGELSNRFREHLRDVNRNDRDASKPVAWQFNLPDHYILANKWRSAAFPYTGVTRRAVEIYNKKLFFNSAHGIMINEFYIAMFLPMAYSTVLHINQAQPTSPWFGLTKG